MKEIIKDGITYKAGDWIVLTRTPHGGYSIGDVFQIVEVTDSTGTFTAKHKTLPANERGFTVNCHRKAEPHEIPSIINNSYQIY